ncbi:MAG TPA: glycosyltransferase [Abditibacterium sp.]|jgi:glycosyltransferase involved in cell wall biosynthesis
MMTLDPKKTPHSPALRSDAPLDLVCIGMEDWDTTWRRTQNLMARLARRHPNWRILFVGLPVDVLHLLKRGKAATIRHELQKTRPQLLDEFDNLWTMSVAEVLPERLPGGVALNEKLARRILDSAFKKLGFNNPFLWIKSYHAAHLCGKMGEIGIIYDVGDDWSALYPNAPEKARRVRQADEFLTRRADEVNVVSPLLLAQKQQIRSDVNVIPNGVDVESYSAIQSGAVLPDAMTQSWAKPVIGHTGTLHPARFDLELTLEIARRFPAATIALVGPDFLDDADRSRLKSLPNIQMTGPVAFDRLPAVMAGFDVCFVPTKRNAFSESQNPLKLFEYLAAGLPTVSTPISGFRDHPDLIYLAESPSEFSAQIEAALEENDDRPDHRIALARQNSWDHRVDAAEQAIWRVAASKQNSKASN